MVSIMAAMSSCHALAALPYISWPAAPARSAGPRWVPAGARAAPGQDAPMAAPMDAPMPGWPHAPALPPVHGDCSIICANASTQGLPVLWDWRGMALFIQVASPSTQGLPVGTGSPLARASIAASIWFMAPEAASDLVRPPMTRVAKSGMILRTTAVARPLLAAA
ncbi:MAG: hypothetical protein B7Y95_00125 [Rhizobiales bacterium 32-66-11]|nr:MAG: hypothetical protein B7Y95_00125 [Rhizobiales bacterium 32-66-11]